MPRVWLAGADDAERVTALMVAFRDHMGRSEPSDESMRATIEVLLGDDTSDFLLAAADGQDEPAGACQLRYRLAIWTGTDDCWLEDLFVERSARRTGLGRALVSAAFERARARGCRRIELDVDEDNADALALYRALGMSSESKPPGRNLLVGRKL